MINKTINHLSSKYVSTAILWLAVLTFNNWLLAIIFNRHLLLHDGSVSEFSVINQPHAGLFRGLDIISGVLFLILALAIANNIKWRTTGGWLLILGIVFLGAGNFFDALVPLHCSETVSSACTIPASLSFQHLILPSHAYSSIVIGISYFLLPLGGLVYGWQNRSRSFMYISGVLFMVAAVSFVSVLGQYIVKNSFSMHTFGITQETQMLLIGLWFVAWWQVRIAGLTSALRTNELNADAR